MSGAIGYLLGRVHRELGSEAAHGLVRQGLDGARCAPHEVGNLHDRQVGVVAEHERGALALRECGDLSGKSLPHRPGQGAWCSAESVPRRASAWRSAILRRNQDLARFTATRRTQAEAAGSPS